MGLRFFEKCQMILDDGGQIFHLNVLIPYPIGENHDIWALAAKVHTAGLAYPHLPFQSVFLHVLLQSVPDRDTASPGTANGTALARIRADKDDFLVRECSFFHDFYYT